MISELNDHGFTDSTSGRKVSMLNDALYDAASRHPWPFLETSLNLTFNGSSGAPTNFPANFRAVLDVTDLSNQNMKVEWVRLDDLDDRGTDYTMGGAPQVYYFIGNTINFWPIPAASASVRMRYIRVPAALTESTVEANVEWPIRHHRAIVLGALFRLYDLEDDPELSQRFQGHFEQRLAQMLEDVSMRTYDRHDNIAIDPLFDIDWDY